MTANAWLIVGLGNPGSNYEGTRHNIGATAIDYVVSAASNRLSKHKRANAVVCETRIADTKVILAKPLSYMNESGGPVSGLMDYYDISAERLVVLHDELDIPAATNRIKFGGGDNGHNGLKSIRAAIGTGDFYRLRLGIGRPDQNQDPADFVLKKFSKAEKPEIELMVAKTSELLEMLIKEGLAATQNTFHANGELN